MSLINDALKRAKEAQRPPQTGSDNPVNLQPVEYTRHANTGAVYVSMALLIVAVGAWCLIKGWEATHGAGTAPASQPVQARESTAAQPAEDPSAPPQEPPLDPSPVQTAYAQPSAHPRDFSVQDTPPSPSPAVQVAALSATAALQPPSPMSDFRLQAIFYRATSPSAVINGRTLYIGDKIDEARVLSIARETVKLQAKGEIKVLTLH
jgi:hypothetical protein